MRLPTLLSAASFAFALASPAISQQPRQDMREEIRRIVREEVRAAIHEAMQEIHGGSMGPMGMTGNAAEPKAERREGPKAHPELGGLENEMKELEATLEKLQGEVGRRTGAQARGQLQPVMRTRLDGQNGEEVKLQQLHGAPGARVFKLGGEDGETIELKEVHVAPGARAFKLGGENGETIELKIEGGEIQVLTPNGQKAVQFHPDGERKEPGQKAKQGHELMLRIDDEGNEKSEAPKSKKTVKTAKAPVTLAPMAFPVGQPTMLRAGDGCNCVVVIRCENGTCRIETSCNGSPLTPVQMKTTAPKAKNKKAKGSDDDDDDDDGEQSAAKVDLKLDTGCCETPAKSVKSDCCSGSTCTGCAPAKTGCCDSKPEAAKASEPRKETPKKQIN